MLQSTLKSLVGNPFRKLLLGLFITWTVLLVVLLFMPGSGKKVVYLVEWEDKIVHATLFAVWTCFLYAIIVLAQNQQNQIINLIIILAAGVVLGIGSEWLQGFIPRRSTDVNDFLADMLGTIVAISLVLSVKKQLILVDKKYE